MGLQSLADSIVNVLFLRERLSMDSGGRLFCATWPSVCLKNSSLPSDRVHHFYVEHCAINFSLSQQTDRQYDCQRAPVVSVQFNLNFVIVSLSFPMLIVIYCT